MRILDQWSTADIPYDSACIYRDEGNIIAYLPAAAGNNLKILLAEYSDMDKAKAAMKKLRIAYQRSLNAIDVAFGQFTEYFQFPQEADL